MMKIKGRDNQVWDNTEENVQDALNQLSSFQADMCENDMFSPYQYTVDTLSKLQKETRIFILTDGKEATREQVIAKAITTSNIRTYTFGIGNDCDRDMVQKVAANGRGSCSIVRDKEEGLKSLVITALQHASDPSLQAVQVDLGNGPEKLGEVFRDQVIMRSQIMTWTDFQKLKVQLTCQHDPNTNAPIDFKATASDFEKMP